MSAGSWHILGAGAIGSLFAHALQASDVPCTLLSRRPGETRRTIRIETGSGRSLATTFACEAPQGEGLIERLLLCTKAYDVRGALAAVAHRLDSRSSVLLLANGMGLAEIVATTCPAVELYLATTTEGAFRQGPDRICHAGRGTTLVGSLAQSPPPAWFSQWETLPLACRWEPDLAPALWHKLAINCAINPLTALHGCRNGELVTDPALYGELVQLCDEIAAVSAALGYERTAAGIHGTARQVALDTADNRSSMLQDVSAGRQTEIEFITGYLVDRAAEQGVDVPRNRALLAALRQD